MIQTENLTKIFTIGKNEEIPAVVGLTLSVREGKVFGFLGPNGAGKTTTVRMLTGLIGPTSGEAWIGVSRAMIGYITGPTWLLTIFVGGPLMAIAAVNFSLFVSSRVNDPRVAEQISALLIIPILGLVFAQLAGLIVINIMVMLSFIGGMALLDVGLIYLGATIFQRENILIRWK